MNGGSSRTGYARTHTPYGTFGCEGTPTHAPAVSYLRP